MQQRQKLEDIGLTSRSSSFSNPGYQSMDDKKAPKETSSSSSCACPSPGYICCFCPSSNGSVIVAGGNSSGMVCCVCPDSACSDCSKCCDQCCSNCNCDCCSDCNCDCNCNF